MKYIVLIFLLSSCFANAVKDEESPTGKILFKEFFSNINLQLENEPLCHSNVKLYEQLALSLSVSYNSKNATTISTSCSQSKFDKDPNTVIDIWDCTIQINEDDEEGEYISSSIYVFGITKGDFKYIKGSLRCR